MRYRGHDIELDWHNDKQLNVYYCGMCVFKASTLQAAKAAVDLYQQTGSYGYYTVCG